MPVALVLFALVLLPSVALQAQTVKVIYNLGGPDFNEPANPRSPGTLSQTPGGNLMSSAPGNYSSTFAAAYELATNGANFTVLENFGRDGFTASGLILGTDERFHGTLAQGGKYGLGAVFRLSSTPGSIVYEHDFTGGSDGSYPLAAPIQSTAGDFYGTTSGEWGNPTNDGTVYKISKSGVYSVLHVFNGTDGSAAVGPLVQHSNGSFYGATSLGGTNGQGTIFRINSDGSFKTLYNFDTTHGGQPNGPLIETSDGNLWGCAPWGGAGSLGVIFKITPGGTYTVVHNLEGSDGAYPMGGLVQATDGNFYGTTYSGGENDWGTLFQLTPAGVLTKLHDFNFGDGAEAMGTLLQHTNGNLYGQAYLGGAYGAGTIFEWPLNNVSPFVTFLNVYGVVGAKVVILGQDFQPGITKVYFNGVLSPNPEIHSTYLKAIVPAGATTGPITVTTVPFTLTSNKPFVVH